MTDYEYTGEDAKEDVETFRRGERRSDLRDKVENQMEKVEKAEQVVEELEDALDEARDALKNEEDISYKLEKVGVDDFDDIEELSVREEVLGEDGKGVDDLEFVGSVNSFRVDGVKDAIEFAFNNQS